MLNIVNLVPILDALPALAKLAVPVVDDELNPIAWVITVISKISDAVLIKSNQKKKLNV